MPLLPNAAAQPLKLCLLDTCMLGSAGPVVSCDHVFEKHVAPAAAMFHQAAGQSQTGPSPEEAWLTAGRKFVKGLHSCR